MKSKNKNTFPLTTATYLAERTNLISGYKSSFINAFIIFCKPKLPQLCL